MELGGKSNGITSTTMISTKTLEVKAHSKPYPDPETKPESDRSIALFPIKKENQKPRTRVDQAAEYGECQKNHAASTGGHVVDGCCEFMPGGEEGTPGALKCAACNCHRSFHWKEGPGQRGSKEHQLMITPAVYSSISMQPRGMHPTGEIGWRTSSSSEDMKKIVSNSNHNVDGKALMMMSRRKKMKRVRTKISEEQKEKMKEFAERLGWKMLKKDEEEIDEFCKMVNLKRQVFKVWMHNNKQAMKRNRVTQVNSDDLQN